MLYRFTHKYAPPFVSGSVLSRRKIQFIALRINRPPPIVECGMWRMRWTQFFHFKKSPMEAHSNA